MIAIGPEDAERHWQVEPRPLFPHISGRQVNRCLVKRKKEGAVVDSGTNAFARFTHGKVGQTDNGHRSRRIGLVANWCEIDFNIDEVGVDAIDGRGLGAEEHGSSVALTSSLYFKNSVRVTQTGSPCRVKQTERASNEARSPFL